MSVSAVRPSTLPEIRTTVAGLRCSTTMSMECPGWSVGGDPLDERQAVAAGMAVLVPYLVHHAGDEVPAQSTDPPLLQGSRGIGGADGGGVERGGEIVDRHHDLPRVAAESNGNRTRLRCTGVPVLDDVRHDFLGGEAHVVRRVGLERGTRAGALDERQQVSESFPASLALQLLRLLV